jgi:hypothetical protein
LRPTELRGTVQYLPCQVRTFSCCSKVVSATVKWFKCNGLRCGHASGLRAGTGGADCDSRARGACWGRRRAPNSAKRAACWSTAGAVGSGNCGRGWIVRRGKACTARAQQEPEVQVSWPARGAGLVRIRSGRIPCGLWAAGDLWAGYAGRCAVLTPSACSVHSC